MITMNSNSGQIIISKTLSDLIHSCMPVEKDGVLKHHH